MEAHLVEAVEEVAYHEVLGHRALPAELSGPHLRHRALPLRDVRRHCAAATGAGAGAGVCAAAVPR